MLDSSSSEQIFPEFVTVGDANNEADPKTGIGNVETVFKIAKYDVTVVQWADFMTKVQVIKNDPRGLYHEEMFADDNPASCLTVVTSDLPGDESNCYLPRAEKNITHTPSQGLLFPNRANFPITGISFTDAKRYCNYLHNLSIANQLPPSRITETGAYDFKQDARGKLMEGALYFIPTVSQWYKAAYYKRVHKLNETSYWMYPTQGDQLPLQASINTLLSEEGVTTSQPGHKTGANFGTRYNGPGNPIIPYISEEPHLTPVGIFRDSPGPYGTYDMGGNVRQWTSTYYFQQEGETRAYAPGGSWAETSDQLRNCNVYVNENAFPLSGGNTIGLRIAAPCEPPTQEPAVDPKKPTASDKPTGTKDSPKAEHPISTVFDSVYKNLGYIIFGTFAGALIGTVACGFICLAIGPFSAYLLPIMLPVAVVVGATVGLVFAAAQCMQ
ncbi:MAG: SUMF1/EgtB/PvdO family nonheme iron enzyme [Chthoniobacterales bacterium]